MLDGDAEESMVLSRKAILMFSSRHKQTFMQLTPFKLVNKDADGSHHLSPKAVPACFASRNHHYHILRGLANMYMGTSLDPWLCTRRVAKRDDPH